MKTFTEISEEIDLYEMTGVTPNPDVLGVTSGFHLVVTRNMARGLRLVTLSANSTQPTIFLCL